MTSRCLPQVRSRISVDRRIRSTLQACLADVLAWCASRRLQLNAVKTEVIWLGTRGRLQQLEGEDHSLTIGSETTQPSTVVRDLGVLIDSELTLQKHVSRLASNCFYCSCDVFAASPQSC